MIKCFKSGLLIFFFIFSNHLKAVQPMVLEDKNNDREYLFMGNIIEVYEDNTRNIGLGQITSPGFDKKFKYANIDIPRNTNLNSVYWVRFTLINNSSRDHGWLIELYDFRIDSFDIYIPDGKGKFIVERGGDHYPFRNKKYIHKNFVYDLPIHLYQRNKPETFYIRIYSGNPVGIIGAIRTFNRFAHYAMMEYYVLALFYGIVFSMALYNLFLFFTVKDFAYLFYVLYLISFGIYAMSQDGTGFQFLWPEHPELNEGVGQFALLSIIIWLLLYAKSFLLVKINSIYFNSIFKFLIGFRLLLFLIGFFFSPKILYTYISYFDTFCIITAFIAGIDSYRKGYKPARFYNIAFAVFFLGYIVSILDIYLWQVGPAFIIVYSFNLGAAGEMLLLSLALGDRIKTLIKEKETAQNEIIVQLKEKENLKDRINKDLEQKVNERTQELQEKNRQLDTFVYKASHDIKGPLKSVIGLTRVGMKDSKDLVAHEYFQHILKSTNRLDNLLTELLSMTKVQQAVVNKAPINFHELVTEILVSFKNFDGYEKVNFEVKIEGADEFLSDRQLLYSIIQNMIENSIKYRDDQKKDCYLKININTYNGKSTMKFSDNGLGIPKDMQEHIFDMFFKVNESSDGTGLGLHMVKIAIEKLTGTIQVHSTVGKGSEFLIEL